MNNKMFFSILCAVLLLQPSLKAAEAPIKATFASTKATEIPIADQQSKNLGNNERSSGTPVERLVGHWSTKAGDNLYYSKIKSDGFGSYVLVQPDGNTAFHQYKLVAQTPQGDRVIVQLIFSDGDTRTQTFIVSKDGEELESNTKVLDITITSHLNYVDNKENP
jgi:hypothetical protein